MVDDHGSRGQEHLLDEPLRDVMLALTTQTDLDAMLDEILHQIRHIIPHSTANIGLLDDGILRIARSWGTSPLDVKSLLTPWSAR